MHTAALFGSSCWLRTMALAGFVIGHSMIHSASAAESRESIESTVQKLLLPGPS